MIPIVKAAMPGVKLSIVELIFPHMPRIKIYVELPSGQEAFSKEVR